MRILLALLILTLTALPVAHAQVPPPKGDPFLRGPEQVGHVRQVSGTVIGIHRDLERVCYVLLADQPGRPEAAGLGGGGRFFLCDGSLELGMGKAWEGKVRQTDTRLARMGPRWRVLPLFERTD